MGRMFNSFGCSVGKCCASKVLFIVFWVNIGVVKMRLGGERQVTGGKVARCSLLKVLGGCAIHAAGLKTVMLTQHT